MEDEAIVALYLAREETAVRYTAEKYGSRLRALAMRIVQDAPCAEECENDTYLSAWKLIPPHEPRTYLFAFLGRITRHVAIDRCRRRDAEIMAAYRAKTAVLDADGKTELFEQAKAWNDSLEQVRMDDVFTEGTSRTSRDYQNRMNGYATARQNGWMSANDIRELEDLDRIPAELGGDLYLVNGNMVPLTDAGAAYKNNNDTEKEEDPDEDKEEVLGMEGPGRNRRGPGASP